MEAKPELREQRAETLLELERVQNATSHESPPCFHVGVAVCLG